MSTIPDEVLAAAAKLGPERTKLIQGICAALVPAVKSLVDRETAPLLDRIAELEAREYQGVFDPQRSYKKGAWVTYQGSVHCARIDCKGVVPGDGKVWQLMVKRGRDAKEK
jgi:hypothetical protein